MTLNAPSVSTKPPSLKREDPTKMLTIKHSTSSDLVSPNTRKEEECESIAILQMQSQATL